MNRFLIILAAVTAILFLGVSTPAQATTEAVKPEADAPKLKPIPPDAKKAMKKARGRITLETAMKNACSACNNRYEIENDKDDCKDLVRELYAKLSKKFKGKKKKPRVADAGKTKKPDKPAVDKPKPEPAKPVVASAACLTKEEIENLLKESIQNITIDTTRFDTSVDKLTKSVNELWGWTIFIFLLILTLAVLLYVAWPRLGPMLKKLLKRQ